MDVPTGDQQEQAMIELNNLVDLMLRGRREPLPVMPAVGRHYAHERQLDDPAECLDRSP